MPLAYAPEKPWPCVGKDYDGEQLRVNKHVARNRLKASTKTQKRRMVYVPTWVRPILEGHTTRFKGEEIFIGDQGRGLLTTRQMNTAWKKAHKAAKLTWRTPHVCRHTRAAELLSQGVTPAEAAAQLGHTPAMFLSTYSEYIDEFAGKRDLRHMERVGISKQKERV